MKSLPFTKKELLPVIEQHGTPFILIDERAMRKNILNLKEAFKDFEGFKEYFAVKATPNPFILKIFKELGLGTDCSSMSELILSEKVGITGEDIMFTSNNTPAEEFIKAKELGAIINLDDISHLEFLEKHAGLPDLLCFRYNPGPERTGNFLIGNPKEAKYGLTKKQLFEAYKMAKEKGVKRFGLHTMVASNELNVDYIVETARMLLDLVKQLHEKGIPIEFINIGGGIGIPVKPEDKAMDMGELASGIKKVYAELGDISPPRLVMECGRFITGPYGYLITTVRHMKHIYKDYAGVDATMADFMRPGMYQAYHHVTVLDKGDSGDHTYDVVGSLCENNDKFAIDRSLPEIEVGDIIVLHDAGAHGRAMGFNYNGKLRCKVLLWRGEETIEIRRKETMKDYFETLDFTKLEEFTP